MSLLDNRLQAVLSLVPEGSVLLDVGTDHCKLPAEGLRSGRLAEAFASDLREGPLQAAKKQLGELGMAAQIPLFLSDGLRDVPKDVLTRLTAVSIAGMGGEAIRQILGEAPVEPPLWILQPMSAIYELLDFLAAAGYAVEQGVLAREDEKFYRAFTARKTGVPYPADYFGMHRGDPLYLPYLEREERRTAAALAGLRSARSPDPARIKAAETLLQSIRRAML